MAAPKFLAAARRELEGMARRKTQTYGVVPYGTRAPRGAPHALKQQSVSARFLAETYRSPAPLSLHLAPIPGADHVDGPGNV